jgi:hypothetical protein
MYYHVRVHNCSKLSFHTPTTCTDNKVAQHWLVDAQRLFDAFVYNDTGSPLLFLATPSEPTAVAKTFLYVFEVILVDLIFVRIYIYISAFCVAGILRAGTGIQTVPRLRPIVVGLRYSHHDDHCFIR